jgi:hypothetical protein
MNLKTNLLAGVAAIALAVPGVSSAATLGLDFMPVDVGVVGSSNFTWTLGYEFNDVTATSVVGLATWNSGVVGNIEIGLWNAGGALLATATVNNASHPRSAMLTGSTAGSARFPLPPATPTSLAPSGRRTMLTK